MNELKFSRDKYFNIKTNINYSGILRKDLSRKDVDREFVLYADILNETNSWLMEESVKKCGDPALCKKLYQEKNPAFVGSTLIFQVI